MDYTVLLWVAAVPAVLVGQIYMLGRRMSQPEKIMHPTMGGASDLQQRTISGYQDWLRSEGLEFRTSFKFGFIQVVVLMWSNPRYKDFLNHTGGNRFTEDWFKWFSGNWRVARNIWKGLESQISDLRFQRGRINASESFAELEALLDLASKGEL